MWDIKTGEIIRKLEGHDSGSIITSLAVSECSLEDVNDECNIELDLEDIKDD